MALNDASCTEPALASDERLSGEVGVLGGEEAGPTFNAASCATLALGGDERFTGDVGVLGLVEETEPLLACCAPARVLDGRSRERFTGEAVRATEPRSGAERGECSTFPRISMRALVKPFGVWLAVSNGHEKPMLRSTGS